MAYLPLFLSGAAGLLYQIAWTRGLIAVTSATSTAQAFVLATFMLGLGLGAWLAGRNTQRIRRPLLAYAVVELLAALCAVVSLPLIVSSHGLRDALMVWGLAGSQALWAQLCVVSAFLLVPCALLGLSLPLAIEHVERASTKRSSTVGWAYGVNTLGASLGCWLAGFVTLEHLGLQATTWLGASAALVAASFAIVWQRPLAPRPHDESADVVRSPLLLFGATLAGFAGLGLGKEGGRAEQRARHGGS